MYRRHVSWYRTDAVQVLVSAIRRLTGVAPDARAMATVAWAAGRGPGWPKALDLLREMRPTMAAADFYMMALGACERLEAVVALLRPNAIPNPNPNPNPNPDPDPDAGRAAAHEP